MRQGSSATSLQPLVGFTDDVLFGQAWTRPELSPRDRSLVTVASLVTSGRSTNMNIEPKPPTTKAPAEWFTGDVYIDPIHVRKAEPSRMA